MKLVKIVIPILTLIFVTFLIGSAISNYQNTHEKNTVEMQKVEIEIDNIEKELLELCTNTDNLVALNGCKGEDIPNLIETCKGSDSSNHSVCSDIRLKEFSNTIDERIKSAEIHLDELLNKLDIAQSKAIELCSVEKYNLDSCKSSMLSIKNECTKTEVKNIPSCNDPRIQMILDSESNISPSGQTPVYDDLYYLDAERIRDCWRENQIFADQYMPKIVNLDSISEQQEEFIQSSVERISICSADITEIENRRGVSSTDYWEDLSKIQSLFDKVCSNTGKLCGYTFHKP